VTQNLGRVRLPPALGTNADLNIAVADAVHALTQAQPESQTRISEPPATSGRQQPATVLFFVLPLYFTNGDASA